MAHNKPSQQLQAAWASAPKGQYIYETLEISHSKFSKTYYITASTLAFDAKLEDGTDVHFEAFPFSITLPVSDAQGSQEMRVSLQNVGRELVDEIEAASTKPDERVALVYRVYLASDKSEPQNLPVRLSISELAMDDEAVTGIATRSDVLNFPFPSRFYDPEMFPGLER